MWTKLFLWGKLGICGIFVHLLHDFLVVGPSDLQLCHRDLNKIMFLFKDISIPIKQSKTFLPCTLLTFLGIELDSAVMEKRLPQDKLMAWSTCIFLNCFNRKSLFLSDHWENSVLLQLCTDASNIGFGCYLGNQYFSGVWPKAWESYHITVKELFPIVLAVQLCAKQL